MKSLKTLTLSLMIFMIAIYITTVSKPVHAKNIDYKTNKIGIHILNTSEIEKAAELVNSNGGDWGFVTIPIQPIDRDKEKWQTFMHKASKLHITPILRITTIPQGGTWTEGRDTDIVDFANFLNELDWPTKHRFVIIFNEVNRAEEWGGTVSPEKYAKILKNAYIVFKERSQDFFILPAGLDNALPNSSSSMSSQRYIMQMKLYEPDIWNYIDGWTSHSYPNPAFSASPYKTGWQSITSYKNELNLIGKNIPVFITETGWDMTRIKDPYRYYTIAWRIWLNDPQVKAVTPFILQAGTGPFAKFSFISPSGNPTLAWTATIDIKKQKGEPTLNNTPATTKQPISANSSISKPSYKLPKFRPFLALLNLENLIRKILNIPQKKIATIGSHTITIEVAETDKQKQKGLSYRKQLGENNGMLFKFDTPTLPRFWMKDMNFPIDIIWIRNNKVVDITKNAPPEGSRPKTIYTPKEKVDTVLEVNAGYSDRNKIKIGDIIDIWE